MAEQGVVISLDRERKIQDRYISPWMGYVVTGRVEEFVRGDEFFPGNFEGETRQWFATALTPSPWL